MSTTAAEEQSLSPVVQIPLSTTSSNENYTRDKIQRLLKFNKTEYVVIENSNKKNKQSSTCWNLFGFPAKLDSNDTPIKIDGFVSCMKCFVTYSYISNSTTFLNKHDCNPSYQKPNSTSSSSSSRTSSTSQNLITMYGHTRPKKVQLPESHSKEMKDLISRWICKDMRPFSVVDDIGFREIAQRCISIGIFLL